MINRASSLAHPYGLCSNPDKDMEVRGRPLEGGKFLTVFSGFNSGKKIPKNYAEFQEGWYLSWFGFYSCFSGPAPY